jgi:hypothetical protein
LEQVFIVSHSYQIYLSFPGLDLNLDCGLRDHVIMSLDICPRKGITSGLPRLEGRQE